jgi:hypothetical protein
MCIFSARAKNYLTILAVFFVSKDIVRNLTSTLNVVYYVVLEAEKFDLKMQEPCSNSS